MTAGQQQEEELIVVGVDGSDQSKDALRWAVRQASLTGAAVEAVMAWEWPNTYGWAPPVEQDFESLATQVLKDTVDEVVGSESNVEVRQVVAEGGAARILLHEAKKADLLVVGSRGHGGFAGTLLGSVSQHCVQHALCPVVILRGQHPVPETPAKPDKQTA
ncbi:MAG TPA: universal stress protein [Pseudonocardiaceae bacterium]